MYDVLALKPGQQFAECTKIFSDDHKMRQIRRYCPDMVVVPAGAVMMVEELLVGPGVKSPCPTSEERSAGKPHTVFCKRRVTMAKPLAVSKFSLTFDQWDACVAGGGCDNYRADDSARGRGTRPVINVSWNDAKRYVDWLNRMSGTKNYRLLSEAEFEYAARAGTSTKLDEANSFGLYRSGDWEWVEDCWHDRYEGGPPGDGSAWTTGCAKESRVVRGGHSTFPPTGFIYFPIPNSDRNPGTPDSRYLNLGFRVGRTLTL